VDKLLVFKKVDIRVIQTCKNHILEIENFSVTFGNSGELLVLLGFERFLLNTDNNAETLLLETRLNNNEVNNVNLSGDLGRVVRVRQSCGDVHLEL
jgi:hypothetical protein